MIVMDWIKKVMDVIMPIENLPPEEDDAKDAKTETKTEGTKTAQDSKASAQPSQSAQPAQSAQSAQSTQPAQENAAPSGFAKNFSGTTGFTRGNTATTSDNGFASMDGIRYEAYTSEKSTRPGFEAYTSETSVRPSLAVVKTPQLTMKIYAPSKYDDRCKQIADDLLKRNAVIVNYEGVSESEQQRIGDFIVGAVYMINGKAEAVSKKIVLYVPSGIDYESAMPAAATHMRSYS